MRRWGRNVIMATLALGADGFAARALAAGDNATLNDVEDKGFDEMETEAANASFEADKSIKEPNDANDAPSPLESEFRDGGNGNDDPLVNPAAEAPAKKPAPGPAKATAAPTPAAAPANPRNAAAKPAPAPQAAPAASQGQAAWQTPPPNPMHGNALPTLPAGAVPQGDDGDATMEAAAPLPAAPAAATSRVPNVAAPATDGAAAASAPSAIPTAVSEGGDPAMEDAAASPDPDVGPAPNDVLMANEFAGAPPFPGARRLMAEGEAPEEYDVEPGDTLFDVCDQLIDDKGYWPKLWALNPEIANPHFIYPGMKLRFYPGDKDTPPFLQVVNEDDVVPVDKEQLSEKQLVHEDVSDLLWKPNFITEEGQKLGDAPPPEVIDPNDLAGIDVSQDFESWGNIFRPTSYFLTVPSFVYAEEPSALGVVASGAAGQLLMSHDHEVIINASGDLAPGSSYTIMRRVGSVGKPSDDATVGIRYDFIAHVTVTQKVEESFVGVPKDERLGILPGDVLMPYVSTTRRIPIAANSPSAAPGNEIIGFEFPDTGLGGTGSYVLFDRGAGEMSVGQSVLIYQSVRRFEHSFLTQALPNMKKPVAKVRIIDASPKAYVGYVESNAQEIYLGDRAGTGAG